LHLCGINYLIYFISACELATRLELVTTNEYVHIQFFFIRKAKTTQSTEYKHRVAIADFWRRSHHDGKISPRLIRPVVVGGVCTPTPFITITYKVAVYAPEWADTLPLFHFYTLYMYSVPQSVIIFLDKFVCSIFPKFSNKAQSYNKIYAR
jgi:hypothetical protein